MRILDCTREINYEYFDMDVTCNNIGLSRDFGVLIHLIICQCFCNNVETINNNQSRFFPCNFKTKLNNSMTVGAGILQSV